MLVGMYVYQISVLPDRLIKSKMITSVNCLIRYGTVVLVDLPTRLVAPLRTLSCSRQGCGGNTIYSNFVIILNNTGIILLL